MRAFLGPCLLMCGGMTSVVAFSQNASEMPKTESTHEKKATIEGLVRDIACPVQNLEAGLRG